MSRCTSVFIALTCLIPLSCIAKVIEDVPGSLNGLESLASALDEPGDRPVHILYIHGIKATAPNDSGPLRLAICTRLHLCSGSDWQDAGREYPDKGEFAPGADPPELTYLGTQIWHREEAEEWVASAPFVQHWVTHLRRHRAVVVIDEINWWPLVMKLKCQQIMTNDAYLAGPNKTLIGLCATNQPAPPENIGHYTYYPWIKNPAPLLAQPSRGAAINRSLKTGLEDWGFSDAFLGVGPLRGILEDGIRQLIVKAAAFDPRQGAAKVNEGRKPYDWQSQANNTTETDQEFVAVTHSLGSFLLLDTFENGRASEGTDAVQNEKESRAIQYVRERTVLMYFFANQVPLLELANLKKVALAEESESKNEETALIGKWAQSRKAYMQSLKPDDPAKRTLLQVIAFSDPSDLLTWRVRPMAEAHVVNLLVRNSFGWFGLFEAPLAAHDNYAMNKDVLRVIFETPKK